MPRRAVVPTAAAAAAVQPCCGWAGHVAHPPCRPCTPPQGIAGAHFLGLSGPTWRGLDILCAQVSSSRSSRCAVAVLGCIGRGPGLLLWLLTACFSDSVSCVFLSTFVTQALLARTCGHAVGARSVATQALANLVFPVGLLAYAHGLADGVLTLGVASRALLGVLLATLAAKAVVEGWHTVPRYCPRRGRRTLAFFIAGFGFFPWPERFPRESAKGPQTA